MSSTGAITFLIIPFYCIPTLYLGLLVGHVITKHEWFRPPPSGHCQRCGYDLYGNISGTCPECGMTVE